MSNRVHCKQLVVVAYIFLLYTRKCMVCDLRIIHFLIYMKKCIVLRICRQRTSTINRRSSGPRLPCATENPVSTIDTGLFDLILVRAKPARLLHRARSRTLRLCKEAVDDLFLCFFWCEAEGHELDQLVAGDLSDGGFVYERRIQIHGIEFRYSKNSCVVH